MATIENEPEVLTTEELAELLRISESTVLHYAVRCYIPGRQIGDEWRFSRAAINDWLRESRVSRHY